MRTRIAVLAASVGMVVPGLALAAPAASAASCSPWPTCFGSPYQVTGTPDNSLWEWTNSPTGGGTAIRAVPNGYTIFIGCQANNGPQEDSKYNIYPSVPSTTWDFAWDGGLGRFVWVYDWWMNTPPQAAANDWYSWADSAHHCNFGGTSQASGGPGPYQVTGADSQGLAVLSRPHTGGTQGSFLIRYVPNGTTLNVACQISNGDQEDGLTQYGHPFTTWDRLTDGSYVYDWYMNTPVVGTNGYSPGMPQCPDLSVPFVALGDSYTAGVGTYNYTGYPASNSQSGGCYRSYYNYATDYARDFTLPSWLPAGDPATLACMSATADWLWSTSPTGQPPQFYSPALGDRTKLVVITVGGNDANLVGILAQCLTASGDNPLYRYNQDNCWSSQLPAAQSYIQNALPARLTAAWNLIRQLAPNAVVVAATYPDGFPTVTDRPNESCGDSLGPFGGMDDNSLQMIHDTLTQLNQTITSTAHTDGFWVADLSQGFTGHDMCSNSPYVNGLMFNGQSHQLLQDRTSYDVESYHPTMAGYAQMASDLASFISTHLSP